MMKRKWATLTVAPFFVLVCCSSARAGQLSKQLAPILIPLQRAVSSMNASVGGIASCGDVSLKGLNDIDGCLSNVNLGVDTTSGYNPESRLRNIWSEDMLLQEMARRSKLALKCHLPIIKDLASDQRPPSASQTSFNEQLLIRFSAIRPAAELVIKQRNEAVSRMYRREMFSCNSFEDKIKNPCFPAEYSRLKAQVAESEAKLQVLVATLPLATDPDVKESLLALLIRTSGADAASFPPSKLKQDVEREFHSAIKKVYSRMFAANRELVESERKIGKSAERFDLPPSLRAAYLSSPQYDALLQALPVPPSTRRVLTCRRDAEFTRGPKRIQAAIAITSIISMGVTFGSSSLAIAALSSASARVAIIGLDFGINSASLLVSGKQIAEACFSPEHAVQVVVAPTCSASSGGIDFISRADAANCAVAAVFGASSAVYQSLTMIKAARLVSPAK